MGRAKTMIAAALGVAAFAAAGAASAAHAKEICGVSQKKFAELEAAQNDFSADPAARIRRELAIRKSLLKDTVDCATEEVLALKSEFDGVKAANPDAQGLKNQFSGWFAGVINYYAAQKTAIDDLGLRGTKDFAKDLAAWREGNFNPTAKIVSNFIVWAGNQDFVSLAQNRLNQVRRGVDVLGLALNEGIRNGLADAEAEFRTARSLNEKARDSLRAYEPADESLATIRASLESLSAVYKKLLELVGKINKEIIK